MLDPASNPSTADPVPHSPAHALAEGRTGVSVGLQFCRDDDDLTGQPASDTAATEVRVWDGDLCLAAVTRDPGGWGYAGGDCGHRIPDEHLHTRFGDWRQALHTLTGITVTRE